MVCAQSISLTKVLSFATVLSLILLIADKPSGTEAVPLFSEKDNLKAAKYCSTKLTEAIRIICQGRLHSLSDQYPGSFGSIKNRSRLLRRLVPDADVFYRPAQRGPTHECCANPCTINDLRAYCADP